MAINKRILTLRYDDWKNELVRWLILVGVTFGIFHPFLTGRAIGAGDAVWYEHMLADFVLQWREGVFPVFVGQTEYAFNGAVYPLRAAPLFQHWAGTIDLITFHQLSFFWLQHLVLVTVAVTGLASCYFCLAALVPKHRWLAVLFAVLYISCPGVLGVVVVQDLYMSWMTIPFLPILLFGLARSFENDDSITWAAISGSLGGLWLAHAPVAFWACLIAGSIETFRLCVIDRNRRSWTRAILGAGAFVLLAQYPFVSVATLQTGASTSQTAGALEHPERIVGAIRTAFPGCFLPLSPGAAQLSDLQLGYALWALVVLTVLVLIVTCEKKLLMFLGPIVGVSLLLFPIPRWTSWFWTDFSPEILRRLTFYWPMHRFYLLLAIFASFGGFCACTAWFKKSPWLTKPLTAALLMGCGWSLWQSREFVEAAKIRTATPGDTMRKDRPENRLLMTHAYGLFDKLPATFSNGVVDPAAQFQVVKPRSAVLPPKELSAEIAQQGIFIGSLDANPGVIKFEPKILLDPGRKYKLTFNFGAREDHGVLQLVGPTFFREYLLPSSGESEAFGQVGANSRTLDLWTTEKKPELIQIRFIPSTEANISRVSRFADFKLRKVPATGASVELISWVPLQLRTHFVEASELETPRVFISGYQAVLNGQPVTPTRSAKGLVTIIIPSGLSEIQVRYAGPWILKFSYYLEMTAWILFLLAIAWGWLRIPPRDKAALAQ